MNSSDDVAVEQAMAIIEVDPVSAAAQLKVLADRGSPRAMAYLGCLHQQGIGVPVNLDERLCAGPHTWSPPVCQALTL